VGGFLGKGGEICAGFDVLGGFGGVFYQQGGGGSKMCKREES